MEREPEQLTKRSRPLMWAPSVLALAMMLMLLWLGGDYLFERAARTAIPALPELGRRTAAVREQVATADAQARQRPRSPETLGTLGMVYHANALHEQARTAYQLAIHADPDDFRWPYYLAVLEITGGENERALTFLTRAVELNPQYPHAWARLGEMYFRRGLLQEAREAFGKTLKLAPHHPHATLGVARLAGLDANWQEAVRLLENALRANPRFGPAHNYLAVAYEQLGRIEDMRRHEGRGVDAGFQMDDPLMDELYALSSTGSILVIQAKIVQNLGNYERAEKLLRRAAELAPEDKDVRLALGRFLSTPGFANRERLARAKEQLEAGLEIDPTYVNTRDAYASVLYQLGDISAAQAQWQQVLTEEPGHAMALMSLGQIYYQHYRDYEQARDYYRRGVNVPPDTPYSLGDPGLGYHRLAMAHWALGDTQEALDAFRLAVEKNSRLSEAYADQARLLVELGRTDEALAVYEQGLTRNPDDSEIRLALGQYLLQAKRFPEARAQLERAWALRPKSPNAALQTLVALAFVELQSREVDAAIKHLRTALRIDPNHVRAHHYLGNALSAKGRRAEAIQHYEAALRADPTFQPAREALARVRGE